MDVTISVSPAKSKLTFIEWISIIVGAGFVAVIVALAIVHTNLSKDIDEANQLRDRCTTSACLDTAVWLMGNQDNNVEPCNLFYDNACLNYSRRHPLSGTAGQETSVIYSMKQLNLQRLRTLVESYKPGQWGDLDSTALRTNYYYTACINQYQRALSYEGSQNPLISKIKSQLGQDWWVVDQSKVDSFSWQTAIQNTATEQNFVFFHLKPVLGPGERQKYYLQFMYDTSPSFTWAINHMSLQEDAAFKDIVRQLATLLVRDHRMNISDSTVLANVDTFVDDVARVTYGVEPNVHQAKNADRYGEYNKIFTWAQFKQQVGSEMDFDAYVQKYTGMKFNDDTNVVEQFWDLERKLFYTRDTLAVLTKLKSTFTKSFNRMMNNYIAFRIAFYWLPHLSYEYNHLYRNYYQLAYGTFEFPPDWETCFDLLSKDMPKALSALFVTRYYQQDVEASVEQVSDYVNSTLLNEISLLNWMDLSTKEVAVRKLKSILLKIGKPDTWSDAESIAAEMDLRYKGVVLSPRDHFSNVNELIPIKVNEDVRKLNDDFRSGDEWPLELYDARLEYNPRWHEILVPAGMLQEPLVSPGFPAYMNFGGFGTWLASAMIASIDEEGQLLDEFNNQINWWSAETWQLYNSRKRVIIDFYNKTTIDAIQQYVNITDYAPQAIRETGGIRQAYNAYQEFIRENGINEQALPSLSHGDIYQNFFYAYASSHCDSWSSQSTFVNLQYLNFMPTFIHVDGGVAQIEHFWQAFSCSVESRMRPPDELLTFIF